MPINQRVLLVERDRKARDDLARALVETFDGLQVEQAESFAGALEAIERSAPNLIVSALELPDGSGLDLLSEVGTRGLPVAFVIVCDDADAYRDQLRSTGNVRLLERPVGLEELSEVVGEQLVRATTIPPSGSPFAVADYLQLAAMAQRSLCLEVSAAGALVGKIFVVEGQAYHASDQRGEGTEAFARLALATEVDVSIMPLPRMLGEPSLEGDLQGLLFDAARVADEERRARSEEDDRSAVHTRPAALEAHARAVSASSCVVPPPRPKPAALASVWGAPIPRRDDDRAPEIQIAPPVSPLEMVASIDGLRGAALTDAEGSVEASHGHMDIELGAKIAALTGHAIGDAVATLGIPNLLRWRVSAHDEVTWFVLGCGGGLLVAEGDCPSNPRKTMQQLALALEGLS